MMQAVVENEADGTDDPAFIVLYRNAGDDKSAIAKFHNVEQDRPARFCHLAHQAVRDHLLDVAPQRIVRAFKAERFCIFLVDPDDARFTIDGNGALAERVELIEKRADRTLMDGNGVAIEFSGQTDRTGALGLQLGNQTLEFPKRQMLAKLTGLGFAGIALRKFSRPAFDATRRR